MAGNGLVDCFAVIGIDDDGPSGARTSVVRFHAAGCADSVTLGMKGGADALAQFAWPKLRYENKRSALAPFKYTFALTLEDGQYLYGFCLKMLPPAEAHRYDKGARYPEVGFDCAGLVLLFDLSSSSSSSSSSKCILTS
jgi:hypothetical protein